MDKVEYQITQVAVEKTEDNTYTISLICDEDEAPQVLTNFANFTYKDDAIEYAIMRYVDDNVQLALVENDEVTFYSKEEALETFEYTLNETYRGLIAFLECE
ncbi:hypothetical protein [Paenibacillus alba]|uniref:DUF1292 domain-containing protein n=1 Tax=Paenibacillus alba TaxID=1197127 RepID=A0ABU6FY30_9BACL|nr:hypothetical protein [Paenibacillus alba]MEC0226819.1 hypothetical protein [Paenibacillus alba]